MYKYIIFLFISLHSSAQSCFRGDSLFQKQQYLEAKSSYKYCQKDEFMFAKEIGDCSYLLGHWQEAKKQYLGILTKDYNNLHLTTKIASIYEQESNIPKAIKYYTKSIELDSTNSHYYKKIGNLYYQAGSNLDALSYYRKAINYNKYDVIAITQISNILYLNSEILKADSIIQVAINLSPDNIKIKLLYSKILYAQKKYPEVYSKLIDIALVTPLNYKMNTILGYSAYHIDSLDQAIFYLNTSRILNPNAENNYYYLGIIYAKLNDTAKAELNFEMAIDKGISSKIPYYYRSLATIAIKENKLKKAIAYYKSALIYDKRGDTYHYLANTSYTYYKDKSIALNYYKKHLKSTAPNQALVIRSKERIITINQELHMKKFK